MRKDSRFFFVCLFYTHSSAHTFIFHTAGNNLLTLFVFISDGDAMEIELFLYLFVYY